jgi:hypothetical protein
MKIKAKVQGLRCLSGIGHSQNHGKRDKQNRLCNLCTQEFLTHTLFDRYCEECREKSELLKFSDWLPELDEAIADQISA